MSANATKPGMDEDRLYQEIGGRIAARRKNLGLKQADVAKRMGISRASVANIEVGRQRVLIHQLYRLAEALEIGNPSELMPARSRSRVTVPLPMEGVRLSKRERDQDER